MPTVKDGRRDSPGLGLVPGWFPVLFKKNMNMKKNDLKAVLEELSANFCSKEIQGICILTQKDAEGTGVAAMVGGDIVEVIIAIMRAMANDDKICAIIRTAAENYDLIKERPDSFMERLFKGFNLN